MKSVTRSKRLIPPDHSLEIGDDSLELRVPMKRRKIRVDGDELRQ